MPDGPIPRVTEEIINGKLYLSYEGPGGTAINGPRSCKGFTFTSVPDMVVCEARFTLPGCRCDDDLGVDFETFVCFAGGSKVRLPRWLIGAEFAMYCRAFLAVPECEGCTGDEGAAHINLLRWRVVDATTGVGIGSNIAETPDLACEYAQALLMHLGGSGLAQLLAPAD